MKTLKIDEKFSIVYDDENNDRPLYVERYGSRHANIGIGTPNWITSMIYALLENKQQSQIAEQFNTDINESLQKAYRERGEELGKFIHEVDRHRTAENG